MPDVSLAHPEPHIATSDERPVDDPDDLRRFFTHLIASPAFRRRRAR
jgi:hypothetical protein